MKVLAFSLFSEIWEHSIPEHLIISELQSELDFDYVFCGGILSDLCVAMEARQINAEASEQERGRICSSCTSISCKLSSSVKGVNNYLRNFLSTEDEKKINEIFVEMLKAENPILSVIDNFEVGKMAMYETVLKFKKTDLMLSCEAEKEYFKIKLKNVLKTYFSFKCFLEQASYYEAAIIYSPQYAVNHIASELLISLGVRVYFMEAGVNVSNRLDTMRFWHWDTFKLVNPLISNWKIVRDYHVTKSEVRYLTRHFESLLIARSHMVYSEKFKKHLNVREYFRVPAQKKIVLATMSSYDEAYSAYYAGLFPKEKACSDVFQDQIEWIKYLINFANSSEDIFLIVRVHPRDFPNKRERIQSYQAKMLANAFDNLDGSYAVNWPDENISLYELLDEVDLLLTGWSATAVEAASIGIPVVTYDSNMPSYPVDIMLTGRSVEEYEKNIRSALVKGWSFSQVVSAYHWLAANHVFLSHPVSTNFSLILKLFSFKLVRGILKVMLLTGVDIRINLILLFSKAHKEGIASIGQVIKGVCLSSDCSSYVTERPKMSKIEFEKFVKFEFLKLMNSYYKKYDKNKIQGTVFENIRKLKNE